jgi:hypothetical protein
MARQAAARRRYRPRRAAALAPPHLDVEGELLVDLLLDRHPPEPRAQRAFHCARRILETPAVNSRQASVFSRQLGAALAREAVQLRPPAQIGFAPFGVQPAAALHPVERRIQRPLFDDDRVVEASSMNLAMAYPCRGPPVSVLRMRASSVPCSRALGFSRPDVPPSGG